MIPPAGTSSSPYNLKAANWDNSKNVEPGSNNFWIRSRATNFPEKKKITYVVLKKWVFFKHMFCVGEITIFYTVILIRKVDLRWFFSKSGTSENIHTNQLFKEKIRDLSRVFLHRVHLESLHQTRIKLVLHIF